MSREKCKAKALTKRYELEYFDQLSELAIATPQWEGLPETVDPRLLEIALFEAGQVLFFRDEYLGFLALRCTTSGPFDENGIPKKRYAYSVNGYHKALDETNSVLIFNNVLRSPSINRAETFARRLANLDRTFDVNIAAQKTPVVMQCSEDQKLSITKLAEDYTGDVPLMVVDEKLDLKGITAINTQAPFIADKLMDLKDKIWNEAMTYLGIPNISIEKKERLISDEVNKSQGGSLACRMSRLAMRNRACQQINAMFGLNMSCDYHDPYGEQDESPEEEENENE